jgi:hypothetical protein
LTFVSAGCDRLIPSGRLSPEQFDDARLRDVAELYRLHQITAKKPPRSLRDFNTVGGDAGAPLGYSAIRSGQVVVRWEAMLPDTEVEPTSSPSEEVLAYIRTVPEQGGPVLMLDRRIRHMTAEEFKAAKLAGTEGTAARKNR